jgi:hypothetical protein
MGFHEVPWNSMRFYDVLVNRSVPTEANRGLTSYMMSSLVIICQQPEDSAMFQNLPWGSMRFCRVL